MSIPLRVDCGVIGHGLSTVKVHLVVLKQLPPVAHWNEEYYGPYRVARPPRETTELHATLSCGCEQVYIIPLTEGGEVRIERLKGAPVE